MVNNLHSLKFESYKDLKTYCIKNKILIDLNDEDFQYLFKNILNYSESLSIADFNNGQIDPYQYTL